MREFLDDWALFEEIKDKMGHNTAVDEVVSRHLANHTSNKQLKVAIDELGCGHAAGDVGFLDLLRKRASCLQATQIVEDANGLQTRSSMVGCRKYRRPATAMAHIIEKKLVSGRHNYADIEATMPAPWKLAALPKEAFQPNPSVASLDFSEVVSVHPSAPYYSPSAERMTTPAADLAMLRHARSKGDLCLVARAWLGEAFDHRNEFAISFRETPSAEPRWFIGLYSWPKSAVLLWPVFQRRIGNETCFEFNVDIEEPPLQPIFELDSPLVEAVEWQWRSWLWQCQSLRKHCKGMAPAVRPFMSGKPRPWIEVACKAAFWRMSATQLRMLARDFKVAVPSGASLFELIWAFCEAKLPDASEEELLAICHSRVAKQCTRDDASEALMQVDEALEVVEPCDVQEVKSEQERQRKTKAEQDEFNTEFRSRARSAAVRAAAKAKPKGKATKTATLVLPHHLEQKEATRFLPAGAAIWRANFRGEWNGHMPPHRRVTESYVKHGSSELALKACLRKLWSQKLAMQGLSEAACPIEGLFSEA